MRKFSFIIIVNLFAFLTACTTDKFQEHEVGDNLIDNSTEVRLIDTFTIQSSTVKLDSIPTSGQSNILFGSYEDEYFGRIRSDFYALVGLGEIFRLKTVGIDKNKVPIRYDSLVFISYPTRDYLGDTLLTQNMSIHRVTEKIESPKNQSLFYAHTTFPYDTESLADASFVSKPITESREYDAEKEKDVENDKGGIRFKMKDPLGLDIVRMVNEENDTVRNSTRWAEYFQGIVLKASETNSLMLSYGLETGKVKMRLYYTYTDFELSGTRDFHDFPIVASALNFTNVKSDFSTAPYDLNQIVDETIELSSDDTGDLAFAHSGLGILTKLKIPYIEQLNTVGLGGGVLRAELNFHPKEDSFDDDQFTLPNVPFALYQTDEKNQFLAQLPGANSVLRQTRNRDEAYYSIDVTSYVNSVLANGQEFEDGLLLTLPLNSFGVSMNRLVIENNEDSDFRIRLKVKYVVQNF